MKLVYYRRAGKNGKERAVVVTTGFFFKKIRAYWLSEGGGWGELVGRKGESIHDPVQHLGVSKCRTKQLQAIHKIEEPKLP